MEKSAEIQKPAEAPKVVEKPMAPEPTVMAQEAVIGYGGAEKLIEQTAEVIGKPIDVPEAPRVEAEKEDKFEKINLEYKKAVEGVFTTLEKEYLEVQGIKVRVYGEAAMQNGLGPSISHDDRTGENTVNLPRFSEREIKYYHKYLLEDREYRNTLKRVVGENISIENPAVQRFLVVFATSHETGHAIHFERSGCKTKKEYLEKNPTPLDMRESITRQVGRRADKFRESDRKDYRKNEVEDFADTVAIKLITNHSELLK